MFVKMGIVLILLKYGQKALNGYLEHNLDVVSATFFNIEIF